MGKTFKDREKYDRKQDARRPEPRKNQKFDPRLYVGRQSQPTANA